MKICSVNLDCETTFLTLFLSDLLLKAPALSVSDRQLSLGSSQLLSEGGHLPAKTLLAGVNGQHRLSTNQ